MLTRSDIYTVRPANALDAIRRALDKFKMSSIEICRLEGSLRKTLAETGPRDKKPEIVERRDGFGILIGKKVFLFKPREVLCRITYERIDGDGNPIIGCGRPHRDPNDKRLPKITRSEIFIADLSLMMFAVFTGEILIEKEPGSKKENPFYLWRIK